MNLNLTPRVVAFDPLEMPKAIRHIVLGLGRGWSNREIAQAGGKTEGTVKVQLAKLVADSGMDRFQLSVLGSRMLEAMAS